MTLGYGLGEIADAVSRQVHELAFPYSRNFTTRAQDELADAVIRVSPPGMASVFFTSGGSEATESALKIARLYYLELGLPQKHKVLSRWPSYHGNTLASLALSGRPSWRQPFEPMLGPGAQIAAPYPLHDGEPRDTEAYGRRAAQAVEDEIRRQGPETVAALIVEPIIGGTAPAVMPPPNYWALVREICVRHHVLLIADEVLTGFGRTGRWFGLDHWAVTPDLITCGKGISGGYVPLGAVVVRDRVMDAFRHGDGRLRHSFTYTGHPVACAAGIAAIAYVGRHHLVKRAEREGTALLHNLARLTRHPQVAEVRGVGLLAGVEFVGSTNAREVVASSPRLSERVAAMARRQRVLFGVAANGDQIQLTPPLTATRADLAHVVDVLDWAIESAG